MKQILKICGLLLLLSSCVKSQDPSPQTLLSDFRARQDIKNEKYEDALSKYYSLLESNTDRYGTHSNIGVLLNMVQKPEDALKSLQYALLLAEQQKDPVGLFTLHFNLGVYFGAQKKVTEALESYQAALDVLPTSMETKTNIELLVQQQQQQQKQDQKNKDGQGQGDSKDKSDKDKDKNKDKDKKDDQDKKDKDDKDKDKDNKDKDKKDDKDGEGDKDKDQPKKPDQPRENSAKYKPRPFKGDQLSEGDVKKILGELRNQEQKIRANFDKKEKGKSRSNEKDW